MAFTSVPAGHANEALDHVRKGGTLLVPTYGGRTTMIDAKVLARFEALGAWLLKAEGEGYRLRSGKGSVYLVPGQLVWNR